MAISSVSSALSAVTSGASGSVSSVSSSDAGDLFKDIYGQLIGNVNTTDSAFQGDIVKAAEGELDNPQQLAIDSTKASIALQMLTSVRNNALEAYNDIIKMTV